jgi:acetaldehyde dehydrogenase (acetylating)
VGTGGNNNNVKNLTKNTLLDLANKSNLSSASFEGTKNIKFYPNPVQNELQIQYDGDLTTSIYGINGAKLVETKLKTIDMSKMASGTYVIKTVDNETQKTNNYKIIKK